MPLLKVKTELSVSVPDKTKIIRNDEWITFAKKENNGNVSVLTCLPEDAGSIDLHEDKNWITLSKAEVEEIANMFK